MARTPKATAQAPSTMKELKDTLWKAADKLRGSMDASQYKDVILGLVFLKYVSDAFDERRTGIRTELSADGYDDDQIAELIDDTDEYTGRGVFWVPTHARWEFLAQNAKGIGASADSPEKSIGALIDEAMDAVMQANPQLSGTLPRIFNRDNVDQRRLGELIDLFNSARFTTQGQGGSDGRRARDLLGEVYEYFLEKFAAAEGKRGGEFYTPAGVVRVLVEMLQPTHGRVYDPACGSGGMFVQAEKFIDAHHGEGSDISVYGQELNERTWRMAKMNLAIHGLTGNLGPRWGDTFARDLHPDLQADFVMANPPFNIKDWARNESDPRWRFGVPPAGNANSQSSRPVGRPVSSWRTARCRRTRVARVRSAPRSSRPTSCHAWWRCRRSCSARPGSRCACGSSPKTRARVPARCCSSTPETSATWSTAPSEPSPTKTSRRSRIPTTPGSGVRRMPPLSVVECRRTATVYRDRSPPTRTPPASPTPRRSPRSRPPTTP